MQHSRPLLQARQYIWLHQIYWTPPPFLKTWIRPWEQWWSNRATELQEAADRKHANLFYDGLKAIYGPQANGSSSILNADAETRLTEPSRILERWAEHFSDVLTRSSTISQAAIDNIAQRPLMDELAQRPTLDETTAAIKKLSSGKAAGPDAIALPKCTNMVE